MKLFLALLGASRGLLGAAALASLVYGAASIMLLALINATLAALPDAGPEYLWRFAGIALLMVAAQMGAAVLFMHLSQRTQAHLRRYIAARVIAAPYRRLEETGSGQVRGMLADDTNNVSTFFVSLPVLIGNTVAVLGGMGYLAWLSPTTFGVACAVLAAGMAGYHLNHKRVIRYLRSASDEQDRLFGHFDAMLAGAKELKLNRSKSSDFESGVLRDSIDAVRRDRAKGLSLFAVSASWGRFLFFVLIGVALFYPAWRGDFQVTTATGYVLVFLYIMAPLENLLNNVPVFNVARVSAARIEQLTRTLDSTEHAATGDAAARASRVRLAGITHSYYREQDDDIFTLGPINLEFAPGEVVFLVGGNGCGKTTLAKLLLGLYVPESGQILVDDVAVTPATRDAYRQRFSAIFPDFHLFDSLMGLPKDGLDALANDWLAKLHLSHKVQVRAGSFSTRALSQGQRKRLALVAACLEDRPFLVFDEWAADQDPAFKEVFYCEILPTLRAQGKTVLVISHDDRYFGVGDRLLKMEEGQVVQETAMRREEKKSGGGVVPPTHQEAAPVSA